jgi:drug/metabolite transporter (DMT)-like permease
MGKGAVLLALALCFFWGGLTPALKISLQDMPPLAIGGWRFLSALLVIGLYCKWRGIGLSLPQGCRTGILLFALLFVGQIAAINLGTRWTGSSHAIVLLNTSPLFLSVMAHLLLPGDRLSRRKTSGLLIAFSGVVVVFVEKMVWGAVLWGNSLALLSGFLLALVHLRSKKLLQRVSPFQLVFWQMVVAVPLFFVLSELFEGPTRRVGFRLFASIVYQGVVIGGFCFVTWAALMQRHPASKLVAYQFSVPVFGVILSYLVLSEAMTVALVLGVSLVAAGIYLVNSSR